MSEDELERPAGTPSKSALGAFARSSKARFAMTLGRRAGVGMGVRIAEDAAVTIGPSESRKSKRIRWAASDVEIRSSLD